MSEPAVFGVVSTEVLTRKRLLAERPCPHACGETVLWAFYHKTQRAAPLNMEPGEDGNILLDPYAMTYIILGRDSEERAQAITDKTPLYTNHYATCKVLRAHREQEKERVRFRR